MRYSSGIILALFSTSAMATTPCDYTKNIESTHLKRIEQTKIIDKKINMAYNNQMRCTVKIESLVDSKWYKQNSTFTFDPFVMTADEGCDRAINRAKAKVYNIASPELVRSKTDMNCEYKKPQVIREIKIPLPNTMLNYGEHREVRTNPKCRLEVGSVKYKAGYVLHGYKEVCE